MPEILLIDDEQAHLRFREAVLRDAGFSVSTAGDAASALNLLRDQTFAAQVGLIITDHVMPGATGAAFVKILRNLHPSVPVLIMTGMVEAEEEYAGLNVQMLQKPCPPPDLIRRVTEILGEPEAPRN